MKIAIISITEKGRKLSLKISSEMSKYHEIQRFFSYKNSDLQGISYERIGDMTAKIFSDFDALIYICACGIAVRSIAPYVDSKISDPAVLVADDSGNYVISLLSGHIGGANRLTEIVSEIIGAQPIITTATDIGGKFSPDSFACANGLLIRNLNTAKLIAAAVLNGEKIGLKSEFPCKNVPDQLIFSEKCRVGLYIGRDTHFKPFDVTLNLVPKNIVVGIGCKKNTPCDVIENRVKQALSQLSISPDRIRSVSSLDVKSEESGLLEFCRRRKIPINFYSAEELMSVYGDFTASDFVKKTVGVDNVCERSAAASGGKLIMRKNSADGVTVAAAELDVEIDFERKIL